MTQNIFDSDLFAIFLTIVAILLGLPGFFFTIPNKTKNKKAIFLIIGALSWSVVQWGIYVANSDKKIAYNRILLSHVILVSFVVLGLLMFYVTRLISKNQNSFYDYLPKPLSQSLQYGLSYLENIINHYASMPTATSADKGDAMSAVLIQMSLTTIPGNIKNLIRIGIFEVRNNGFFRLLATHNIDPLRIPKIERTFSWKPESGKSIVGLTVNKRETVLIPDLENADQDISKWYEKVEQNRYPGYITRGILCVPIFDTPIISSESKCLAVISVSSSVAGELTERHKQEVEEYGNKVRTLLNIINSKILFDPDLLHGVRAITISGEVGSGKSTLVAELSGILSGAGWRVVSIGSKFREFCDQHNITVDDIEQLPDEMHKKFDDYQKVMLKEEELIIVEGRMSGYFAKDLGDVLTIYCDLPSDERMKRTMQRENFIRSKQEILKKNTERDEKDMKRYERLYGVKDYRNKEYYRLYLNTSPPPFELAKQVLAKIREMAIGNTNPK